MTSVHEVLETALHTAEQMHRATVEHECSCQHMDCHCPLKDDISALVELLRTATRRSEVTLSDRQS